MATIPTSGSPRAAVGTAGTDPAGPDPLAASPVATNPAGAGAVAQAVADPGHDAELAAEGAEVSRHAHPSDGTYILIALGLAVLTAGEVGLYYLKSSSLTTGVLLALMVLKFGVVVGFFMHLRFDSPVLRRLFVFGLSLAVFVYTLVFFMFGVYHF